MTSTPELPSPQASAPQAAPDFAPEVVASLYRYRKRSLWVCRLLVGFGFLGLHRFYLGKPFTGFLMLLSAGGGLVWWIYDVFQIKAMANLFNAEEQRRKSLRIAPQGLGFLPPQDQLRLDQPPLWAARRSGRARVVGSALLLAAIGFSLGVVSGATGVVEPVVVLVLFVFVSLIAARWLFLAKVPLVNALVMWVHRLRLYYHTVDPGNVWVLAARPVIGVFASLWQRKMWVEVRLYLQLGAAFALLFAAGDLLEFIQGESFWRTFGGLVAEIGQNLAYTYVFVAPAGALLTTQLLLEARDRVVWLLSLILLAQLYVGWWLVAG